VTKKSFKNDSFHNKTWAQNLKQSLNWN